MVLARLESEVSKGVAVALAIAQLDDELSISIGSWDDDRWSEGTILEL